MRLKHLLLTVAAVALLMSGCGRVAVIDDSSTPVLYSPKGGSGDKAHERYAPFFQVYDFEEAHNRIGTPKARSADEVYIDPDEPALYYEVQRFTTGRASYVNYIYRIHFTKTPFSLVPFTITAGDHPGLLVIVTVDERGNPVLISQAGTCGCYVVVLPTDYLPKDAYPERWSGEPVEVFGETFGPVVAFRALDEEARRPRLMVEVRPDSHRVVSLSAISGRDLKVTTVELPLFEEKLLHNLPYPGGVTSFFYTEGPGRAHVKGAGRPWELLLMSWWAFDLYVGEDKDYGDHANPQRDEDYNPFYTSLKFWAREESDMADFPRFLKYWGWNL